MAYYLIVLAILLKYNTKMCYNGHFIINLKQEVKLGSRAGRYISCNIHAHLVSKAGSLISAKSPSPVFNGAAFNTRSRSSLTSYAISLHYRRYIAFDNERFMNIY